MIIETPADNRRIILSALSSDEQREIATFAATHKMRVFASENIEFDGWLTLWPPQSQCFGGQTTWLACEVRSCGDGWNEPRDSEEAELGDYATLSEALEAIAERHRSFEQYAQTPIQTEIRDEQARR
jgi:hypothetical protein